MIMSNPTLMQMLLDAGYPRSQMFNHCSDLYIFRTPLTDVVIDCWCRITGYNRSLFITVFTDNVTGKRMYDCAFQFDDYWKDLERS